MFEDSLLESGGRFKSKRRFGTSLIAVTIQVVLICILILIPLIYTDALPKQQLMTFLVAPPPPPPPPPPPAAANVVKVKPLASDIVNGALRTPTKIPDKVAIIKEDDTPPPSAGMGGVMGGVPGGVPGGSFGGVLGGIISAANTAAANVPKIAAPTRVRVSQGVTEGMLLRKVQPTYPPLAKQARIQGHVLLQAIINKQGAVENLRLLSGHPMLAPAAIEAVKQWKYRPYLLNNEPTEVETTVDVNFTLSGG